MKILVIRHSEPDYSMLVEDHTPSAHAGFGRDFFVHCPSFRDSDLYCASAGQIPLGRALFHEWRPDLDGLNYTRQTVETAYHLFWENGGELPANSPLRYETAEQVRTRFLQALEAYRQYERVAIVCHGMLMRQFVPQEQIDY